MTVPVKGTTVPVNLGKLLQLMFTEIKLTITMQMYWKEAIENVTLNCKTSNCLDN